MPTLIEFLLARIAEDEQVAQAAASYGSKHWYVEYVPHEGILIFPKPYGGKEDEETRHIARYDPARMLAECETKRRVIGLGEKDSYWDDVLRLLALPYTAHPDYHQEWKP